MTFKEILFEKNDGVGRITINRPEKYNAFTPLTLTEMIQALTDAWSDSQVGVVVLTGAGDRAFCAGGDQSLRQKGGYVADPDALPIEVGWQQLTTMIRSIPKPVIARVNGFAVGGGHILHVICDLSIAAENARFGQVGPKVGSFDPGVGTGELMRAIGMKRAKEMWFMCRTYTAKDALGMGLVNCVVPAEQLDEEVEGWCQELLSMSPTALRMIKHSFQAETDGVAGITNLGVSGLRIYYGTEESLEGAAAFMEKRKPDFSEYR